jgi:hypothetical protein
MEMETRNEFGSAIVKDHPPAEQMPHHVQNIVQVEGRAQEWMAHRAAGDVGDLAVLDVKSRLRKLIEITGVVVMQMGENDIGDPARIYVQKAQGISRRS